MKEMHERKRGLSLLIDFIIMGIVLVPLVILLNNFQMSYDKFNELYLAGNDSWMLESCYYYKSMAYMVSVMLIVFMLLMMTTHAVIEKKINKNRFLIVLLTCVISILLSGVISTLFARNIDLHGVIVGVNITLCVITSIIALLCKHLKPKPIVMKKDSINSEEHMNNI